LNVHLLSSNVCQNCNRVTFVVLSLISGFISFRKHYPSLLATLLKLIFNFCLNSWTIQTSF